MSKIHYFQRYSSVENTVTNNTLQLFARIYEYSTERASKLLSEITGESIEIGIEINQQERSGNSVPDGIVLQRSFKILIESKVDAGVDKNQLLRHSESFSNESQKILLLLTKQRLSENNQKDIQADILKKHPDIIFISTTYEEICKSIKTLFAEYESEMTNLVEDYIEYCNDANLFDQSSFLMRIVPCGQSLNINKEYGVYFQPSDRGYSKHNYVGIYKDKRVQYIWKIESVFDVLYDGKDLKKELIQGEDTSKFDDKIIGIIKDAESEKGWDIYSNHRFFCGQPIATSYEKESSGGIQGARLLNLRDIVDEKILSTDIIAKKLKDICWS
ncbi:hypothetical protein [Chitinivibrio alkaliphilus]|uniref:Uncharacterized protein n=1 Tax=Chitinivibrio alkaliphilus ACht1 TaxID=1313304 RepID=U7D3Y9_9BACT|nr:hypothetical protein [Chitinivibrio alkaliphilus]ERP30663.1 hypothetical protein CALK_2548 [Chitinivibrio alkaliphilus ACht1]